MGCGSKTIHARLSLSEEYHYPDRIHADHLPHFADGLLSLCNITSNYYHVSKTCHQRDFLINSKDLTNIAALDFI